jgi:Rrf2 family protein
MMLSKKSTYGLKALMNLARNLERGQVLISELAGEENIPKKFLEAILLALKNGGILSSRIGKGGGYSLSVSPRTLTVGRIVRILEGDLAPVSCLGGETPVRCEECDDMASCGIRLVMADVQSAMNSVLDTVTLAEMVERSEAVRQAGRKVFDYSI